MRFVLVKIVKDGLLQTLSYLAFSPSSYLLNTSSPIALSLPFRFYNKKKLSKTVSKETRGFTLKAHASTSTRTHTQTHTHKNTHTYTYTHSTDIHAAIT